MSQYRICIINVYFGHFPNYYYLWLQSAGYNVEIDFLLVTDQNLSNLPDNVHVLKMSLSDFSKRAAQTIGMPIEISHPYKCCDFKVAYGLMFEKELRGYDFWGHCDLDLIWGDLKKFITNNVLEKYEKIYPLGHLALYRNTDQMRKAFMMPGSLKGDYREIFSRPEGYAFDELGGIYQILQKNHIPQYDQYDFADISPVYSQMKIVKRYVDYSDNYKHQIFLWADGKILRCYLDRNGTLCRDEFAYLHLQKRKYKDEEIRVKLGTAFEVLPNGFYPVEPSGITAEHVRRHNRYRGKLVEKIQRKLWNEKMKRRK